MIYYYIYKIQFEDGHYYIGKHRTSNLTDNYSGSGRDLIKFKENNPEIKWNKEIICFCKNKGELAIKESEYIGKLYKTDQLCLNVIAGTSSGFEFTEEHKKLISERTKEAMKKVPKEKLSRPAWNKGRTGVYNEEQLQRMRDAAKKRGPVPEEIRKKGSNSLKGRKLSEETRKKMSENSGAKRPEVKAKISAALKGHITTEETRKKISEANKGKTSHPAWNKGLKINDDVKQKISEKVKEAMKKVPKEVLSKGRKGKSLSDEHKQAISIFQKGRSKSKETCKKISEGKKGKKITFKNGTFLQQHIGEYGWKINPETGKRERYKK